MSERLTICSPKRRPSSRAGWSDLFPYYAGYPEEFATQLLKSANLPQGSRVYDPWNGSGSTTSAAVSLGLKGIGYDLNPVMVIVAKARLLPASEWTALRPLSRRIIQHARSLTRPTEGDELENWFDLETAAHLRRLEQSISDHLIDGDPPEFGDLSCLASVFYVAVFSAARALSTSFRSSNPTWLKSAKTKDQLLAFDRSQVERLFLDAVERARFSCRDGSLASKDSERAQIALANSTFQRPRKGSVDFILSSPPYCTRLDYTAATRIELAILSRIFSGTRASLSAGMLGSVRVPKHYPRRQRGWGPTSLSFLKQVQNHASHASDTYYLKSHLDYFQKLHRSLKQCAMALRPQGRMALVIQDSVYKGIRNDLQRMAQEMCEDLGLCCIQREDFRFRRSMRDVNSKALAYGADGSVTESALVFQRV